MSDTADRPRLRLALPPELESVRRARAAMSQAAEAWELDSDATEDARLVVSELVTNAVLHAATPLTLEVTLVGAGVRICVEDRSSRPVVRPLHPSEAPGGLLDDLALVDDDWLSAAATGRGLAMVEGLADAWGVDDTGPAAKVVWAEVGTGRRLDPGLVSARATPQPDTGHPVRLVAVPLRLLTESERQFDDLQRELQVLAMAPRCPPSLRELADLAVEVTAEVDEIRQATRQAARDALARGDRLVDLSLLLRAGSVVVLERLGELFTRAAREARSGLLLTLPPDEEVAAFRVWYGEELVAQLGGRPPQPCPFPVIPETDPRRQPSGSPSQHPAAARLDAARQQALAELGDDLRAAADRDAVCAALRSQLEAAGASRVAVCLLADDNETVELYCASGFSDEVRRHWQSFAVSADLPASEAIRTGRAVLTRTLAEREHRYPVFSLTPSEDDPTTLCLPVRHGDGPAFGCVVLGSARSREFTAGEMAFLGHAADALGAALAAARRSEAEAADQRHRALVADVEVVAASASDWESFAADLVGRAAGVLAEWCGVYRLGSGGSPQLVVGRHSDRVKQGIIEELERRWPTGGDGPVAWCFGTGRERVFQVVHDLALTDAARDSEHLRLLRDLGLGSGAVVPVTAGSRVAAVLAFANSQGTYVSESRLALARRLSGIASSVIQRPAS